MASEPGESQQEGSSALEEAVRDGKPPSSTLNRPGTVAPPTDVHDNDDDDEEDEEDEEDDEEDEEPKLKYERLTGRLGGLYRNGDATSATLVAGDKMIVGTHNGNVHVLSLPTLQSLRFYHAHSASVAAISISPFPLPASYEKPGPVNKVIQENRESPARPSSATNISSPSGKSPRQQPPVPATPSNSIHIATSSIDGNVCVSSLVDQKDVLLRNFSRPVQSVALSPDFKNDRSYLSGGLAGNLLLTVGGRAGTSSKATAGGSPAANASGWLGTIGLGPNTGKDTVLHSGEGAIRTIKWSLTGKYVAWINEQGIKIMRSNLHLDKVDSDFAWKRISHVDRPDGPGWEEMSGVWKGHIQWIDENNLESDELLGTRTGQTPAWVSATTNGAANQHSATQSVGSNKVEKLVVGWGGTIWIIHVHPGGAGVGKEVGERTVGHAAIVAILLTDCIISGLSLYTPSLLVVLAYLTPEKEDQDGPNSKGKNISSPPTDATPRRGIQHRQNAPSPELRLIDLATSEEVSADALTVSRFQSLSAADYHLGLVPGENSGATKAVLKGAFENLGGGIWTAGLTATRLFTSAASTIGSDAKSDAGSSNRDTGKASSPNASTGRSAVDWVKEARSATAGPGMKIFIHSPYDCVLATKRDLGDHLDWLLSKENYKDSWTLVDTHPEVVSSNLIKSREPSPTRPPIKQRNSNEDFFADDASSTTLSADRAVDSAAEKEKRRIGDRWVRQLVDSGDWLTAGRVSKKVLTTSAGWEHWAWEFIRAQKYEEMTPYLPTTRLRPPLPGIIYGIFLGHHIVRDRLRLKELLDQWPTELYDVPSVITALEETLKTDKVRQDSTEDGETGRDWRILTEGLAKLLLADGRSKEALHWYIRLQDADTALKLIADQHLLDAVADDIPGLILLRVSKEQLRSAPRAELEDATSDIIDLLAGEAHYGVVRPETVVNQIDKKDYRPFLYFYLRALWSGRSVTSQPSKTERLETDGRLLVEGFGDLAVGLFAEYDRPLLMEFLKSSQSYDFEQAYAVCEKRSYVPELVYLLSKTGQTKRALFLIIDRLADVSQAIAFAKSQADPDLWNDLLEYSMDKPRFIRGLLEEVGTAIDPITLVRRIPTGLEIEGLRDGLIRMIREHEIQFSISQGVARVLRGEVAAAMDTLRTGQKRAVKFEVAKLPAVPDGGHGRKDGADPGPGRCVGCGRPFLEDEVETLLGFVCGHVFHLSCLLGSDRASAAAVSPGRPAGGDVDSLAWRSVGAKVTHARIIRGKVADGCPLPVHRDLGL